MFSTGMPSPSPTGAQSGDALSREASRSARNKIHRAHPKASPWAVTPRADGGETAHKTVVYLFEEDRPPAGEEARPIYASILKRLLGKEMRGLLHEELQELWAASGPASEALALVFKQSLGEEMRSLFHEELRELLELRATASPASEAPARGGDEVAAKNAQCPSSRQELEQVFENNDDQFDEEHVARRMMRMATSKTEIDVLNNHTSFVESLAINAMRRIQGFSSFGIVEAPNQPKCLKRVVESCVWVAIVNVIILLNCVLMVYSVDLEVSQYTGNSTTDFLFWCDLFFLCCYTVEFALRIATYGHYYFFDVNWKTNIFDFVLLVSNVWSFLGAIYAGLAARIQNFTWLRMLRLLRLLKAFRVIRLAVYFKSLRAIIMSLIGSVWTLFWSTAMLFVVFFMFSLMLVSRVAIYFNSKGEDLDTEEHTLLTESFGSVAIAMQSLVLDSLGGRDWGRDYFLLATIGPLEQLTFLLFTFLIQIALMNIILGIFVEDAMKNLQPDPIQKAHDLAEEESRKESELRDLCRKADTTGTGTLSKEEWGKCMDDGNMLEFLQLLGFSTHHMQEFFKMLLALEESRGQSEVDIEHFVTGCMRLRGSASSFDMNAVLFEVLSMKQVMMRELKMLRAIGTGSCGLGLTRMG